ncbi:MAG: UDP-N-acetylmuramoyl-L-alanyl-D-glutamate--2,6-diaminopimelate ligase, partial [Clostridia bacterium]|nr:UDP-N-acetylmuramoyl-L-alanyl-D-glutamate--2,6-diaminopimelate ligase [Clostridia bacterium]
TDNSKQVEEGFVFAALSGAKTNGEKYIDEAIANGAAAILLPADKKRKDSRIPYFYAGNPRKAFALMAAAFNPLQPETIVAVTGTNGKTSTSVFTRQIWEQAGLCAASMGTIGIISPVMTKEGNLTSPPPSILYKDVNELASKGVTNLAIEASSHGIDQCRLDGLKIKAAGFTNLTRDHLDYHGDMEHYLLAKLRLFSDLIVPEGAGVINADIAECNIITSTCKSRKIQTFTYGFQGKELRILNHRADALGQNLLLDVLGKRYNIRLPLTGDFQAMNALCALGLAIACGADADKAVEALESLKGSWGRLENVVTLSNGAAVYVDYAHTPDAMENVLNTLRPNTVGKLSIVFGCGGDRDRGKRPQMGAVAAKLADRVIVTDDNPRTEDANFIRSEIMPACPDALEIGDRRKAIFAAIKELNAGDVLVIAGKGHETGQKIGDTVHPFNDTEEAINASKQENNKKMPFKDVKKEDWHYSDVEESFANGLMTGVSENEFKPEGKLTRAMLWTVLARLSGSELTDDKGPFWYSAVQSYVIEQNLSDGTEPEGEITREQLATMLWRLAGCPEAKSEMAEFSDASEIESYATEAIQWAVEQGIIKGDNGKLKGKSGATRGETSAMINRFRKLYK